MRTGGQGQAAVLRERADRRRAPLSAWTGTLGRWEKIPRTVTDLWSAIQRLSPPEHAGLGRVFGLPWARSAFMAFCLRKFGPCGPGMSQMEGNEI